MSLGSLILSEKPFASAVSAQFFERKICFSCYKLSEDVKACTRCHMAYYCGPQCQKEDWISGQHWCECPAFQNLSAEDRHCAIIFQQGRLVARIYGRKLKHGAQMKSEEFEIVSAAKPRALFDLMSLKTEWTSGEKAETFESFRTLFRSVYNANPIFSHFEDEEMKEIYGIVCTNDFNITGYQEFGMNQNFGLALFLQVSRFDHSCDPDLDISFEGNKIRAKLSKSCDLTKIAVDKLTISYYPGFNASLTSQRKRLLSKYYLFDCDCALCLDKIQDSVRRFSVAKICPKCPEQPLILTENLDQLTCVKCQNQSVTLSAAEKELAKSLKTFLKPNKFLFEEAPSVSAKDIQLMKLAETFLHPIQNVCLMQLREKVAYSIASSHNYLIPKFQKVMIEEQKPFGSDIAEVIDLYSKILASYKHYNLRSTTHAVYAGVLGKLYELKQQKQEAIVWYKKAKTLWSYFTCAESQIVKDMEYNVFRLS